MSSHRGSVYPSVLWRSQPEERVELDIEHLVTRRTREFSSATRSEMAEHRRSAISDCRLRGESRLPERSPVRPPCFGGGLGTVTLYRFRDNYGPPGSRRARAAAVEVHHYYRGELAPGAIIFAANGSGRAAVPGVAMLAVAVGRKMFPGPERLRTVLPLSDCCLVGGVGMDRQASAGGQPSA